MFVRKSRRGGTPLRQMGEQKGGGGTSPWSSEDNYEATENLVFGNHTYTWQHEKNFRASGTGNL